MLLTTLILAAFLTIGQIIILFISHIEPGKRRFMLVIDFLAVLFIYAIFLFWLSFVLPLLVPVALLFFFILYNIILFKVIKRIILKNRALRIKEEINDTVIEALRKLAELDYKEAYEILEDALSKYPNAKELLKLRDYLERDLKKTETKRLD